MTDYRIDPINHWNSQWLWWCFRSRAYAGTTPHFLISKTGRFAANVAGENLAVWATQADTNDWNKFDNQSVGVSDLEFYNNSNFPSGLIYLSYIPMYPFSRV